MRKLTFLFLALILLVNTAKSQNTAKETCNSINTFPFYESFNDTIFPPSCWKNYENDGLDTVSIWKRVNIGIQPTCAPHHGEGMLQFNSYSYELGKKALLVSPKLSLSSNAYQVDFWIFRDNIVYTGKSDSVNVYISSDTTVNGALFLGRIHRSINYPPIETETDKWYHYSFTIPQTVTGAEKHIIIEGVSTFGTNIYIDEIRIKENLPCVTPSGINPLSISNLTATIGWNSAASVDSWDVEYGPFGFIQGTGTIVNTTTNSIILSGLTGITKYSYYVKANCSGALGSSNWSDSCVFVTGCTPMSDFPYIENFNDTVFAPVCWRNMQMAGVGSNLLWTRSTTYAHSSPASALFNSSTYAIGTKGILATKELLLPIKDFQLNFWMYRQGGNTTSDSLNVYYNSNQNTTGATLLGTIYRSSSLAPVVSTPNKWYQYSFTIPQTATANCKYIIFEAISKKGGSILIDDVKIDTLSHCIPPSNLLATAIADSGVTLKWNSANLPDSWNVEYGVGNYLLGTGTVATLNTDSLILTNLAQNTQYSFYVQANCGASDGLSSWSGPYFFTTLISCPSPLGLTVSNILDSSVTLSWNPGGVETAWNIEYLPYGGTQGTGTTITVTSNPYTLTGLTPNTKYTLYLQANCGVSDGLSTVVFGSTTNFTTLCNAISVLPYTESFDGTTFPPGCWKNNPTPFYMYYVWARSTSGTTPVCTPHSGVGMANYAYTTYSGVGATLITPPINLPSDFYVAKFWMFRDNGLPSNDDSVNVYYNTVPDYNSNAVLLGTIHRNNSKYPVESTANQWYQYSFQLPAGSAGNNKYILIDVKRSAGTNIYIDDFVVEEQPPCHSPMNLSVIAIKNTEATVTWTARSGESSWNIEYGPLGFIKGTGTVISSNTNPTTLTGLNSSTNYSFYVQANCGGTDGVSIWTGPYLFKTSCQAIESYPFIESFDGATFPPSCWYASTALSKWQRTTTYTLGAPSHSGAGLTYFNCNYNTNTTRAILSSPPFVLPSDLYEVGFWLYRDMNTMEDSVNVYLSDLPNTSYGTLLGSLHNKSTSAPVVSESNQWYYYSFKFPVGSAGNYKYIVFEGVGVNGTSRMFIDDVQIYASTTCPKPTELSATAITSNSATLGWTSNGAESDWRIQYGEAGFLLGSGTTTATHTNPMTLTGLNMGYLYSYYVKADCANSDSLGTWAGPYFFRTGCDTVLSFPFIESFSNPFNTCWTTSHGTANNSTSTWLPKISDASHGVSGPKSGSNFMSLDVYYAPNANNPYYLTSSKIKLDAMPKRATYYYYLGKTGYNSSPYPLKIQVSADDGITWDNLYNHDTTNSLFSTTNALTGWKQNAVYLDSYLNKTIMIRFVANSNTTSYGTGFCNIGVDEFVVENTPDCQPPSSVTISSIRDTSVSLGWTSVQGESSWILEYGPTGFAQGSGITKTMNTNSYTIPGLTGSTQYQYYIKSNCGLGLFSGWSGPHAFRTACPRVTILSATNITTSTADLTWTSNGIETSWKIEYGNIGFTQGTGTQLDVSSIPFTISALSSNTSYSYFVKTMCSGSDTSNVWVGPYTFSTTCNPISNFPFVESFNDSTFAPTCWRNYQTAGTGISSIWKRVITGTGPTCTTHSGLGMAQFNSYTYPANTKAILVTPPFVFDTNYYQVSFWMYRDNGYPTYKDSLNIYLNNNTNTTNATLLGTVKRVYNLSPVESVANNWYKYSFYLPQSLDLNYKYIVFEGVGLYGNNIYLDDIQIDKKTCPEPENITATSITDSSVILAWIPRGSETSWKIEYGLTGFNHGSGILKDLSQTSDTINGLLPDTGYQYYVKSICNVTDSLNLWIGPFNFRTSCINVDSLTVSNITSTSAKLSWRSSGDSFIIKYRSIYDNWVVNTSTDTTLMISCLLPSMTYEVQIQTPCSVSDTNLWSTRMFTTSACLPINLPYSEDFDDCQPIIIPSCTSVENFNNNGGDSWYISQLKSFSPPSALIVYSAGNFYGNNNWFYTPALNLEAGKMFKLQFKYGDSEYLNEYPDFIEVKYGTSPNTSSMVSTPIFSDININGNLSKTALATFSVPNSGVYYIGFHGVTNFNSDYFVIDDISITEENTVNCEMPTVLYATNLGINSAQLNWTNGGNETAWNLQYRKSSDTNYTYLNNISTKPYILNGLEQNTAYVWNLQAICNNNITSYWSAGNSFNTVMSVVENSSLEMNVYSNNNQIHLINNNKQRIKDIIIYDMIGREVGTYAINSADNVLINSNLTIGNYLVKVITENKVGNYKLFIK